VREAYLLVFRLGGPLLVFDGFVKNGDRTLSPVLVDIAPNEVKGSRAKSASIHISADQLLPTTARP
jgi:hypothetical protein